MAYSIPVRAAGIATRPLSNITQPMHPLTRFQWVNQSPYTDPSRASVSKTLVNQGKRQVGRQTQATKRPT
jgi:hypothetical protein